MDRDDVTLGLSLWDAYSTRDEGKLLELSRIHRKAFPHLEEVVHAQMERFPKIGEGRPQRVLREIRHSGVTAFPELFQEFSRREAIYGFGDIQILNMLKSIGD